MGNAIQYLEILRAAKIPDAQAEAISKIIVEDRQTHTVTKVDIARLEGKIAGLESKIETEISRLEGKIAGLESKIETEISRLEGKMETEFKWIKTLGFLILASVFSQFFIK